MTVTITQKQLLELAPNAKPQYRDSFTSPDSLFQKYQVNIHELRLAHFLAQILHETDGLTVLVENLKYTHAEVLMKTWPTRFRTRESAVPYVYDKVINPLADVKLGNMMYGGRMGNMSVGDGFRYRGRGLPQLTGKADYQKYGAKLGVDLVSNPDLAFSSQYALPVALEEWSSKGCNTAASADDLTRVTRLINGGLIGLDGRRKWLEKVKVALGIVGKAA